MQVDDVTTAMYDPHVGYKPARSVRRLSFPHVVRPQLGRPITNNRHLEKILRRLMLAFLSMSPLHDVSKCLMFEDQLTASLELKVFVLQ